MTLHAHYEGEQRDCDGLYTSGQVYEQVTTERADEQFGDLTFKHRVVSAVINLDALHGTLEIADGQITWFERTEEGYRRGEVRWCEDDCAEASWQRDHTAEAAGY